MATALSEDEVLHEYAAKLRRRIPYESGNYPYVTARVKAKKAALYPAETYARLLQMEIPQIARFLGEGPYREAILALGAQLRGVDLVERATSNHLASVFRQIIEMCEGHLRVMVSRYLDRWDVANIKTILRGRLFGATAAAIEEDIVAAGSLDAAFLRGLIAKESMDEVFDALEGTIYEEARRQMGESFDPAKGLAAYEDALAHIYYRRLLAEVEPRTEPSRLFHEFIRREVDILNVRTLLRVWRTKSTMDRPVFLQGGLELTVQELQECLGLDLQGLMGRLAHYSRYEDIAGSLREVEARGVAVVERALERSHLKAASRYSHLHPLSVLPILDFLTRKTREVENLRIVARGKEHRLRPEAMKELLVI